MSIEGDTMRPLICVAIMVAVVCSFGCGRDDAAPAADPQPSITQEESITEEDFESGDTDGEMKPVAEDEVPADPEKPETP